MSHEKSSKNLLQEYCHRNDIDLPVYNQVNQSGTWISTISLDGKEMFAEGTSKKQADKNAANKMMIHLDSMGMENKVKKPINAVNYTLPKREFDIYLLVDYENSSKIDQLTKHIAKKTDSHVLMLLICFFCHSKASVSDVVVHSSVSDACDHYISYLIGVIAARNIPSTVIVYTRDHFGATLVSFVPEMMTVHHCPTEDMCIKQIGCSTGGDNC